MLSERIGKTKQQRGIEQRTVTRKITSRRENNFEAHAAYSTRKFSKSLAKVPSETDRKESTNELETHFVYVGICISYLYTYIH